MRGFWPAPARSAALLDVQTNDLGRNPNRFVPVGLEHAAPNRLAVGVAIAVCWLRGALRDHALNVVDEETIAASTILGGQRQLVGSCMTLQLKSLIRVPIRRTLAPFHS